MKKRILCLAMAAVMAVGIHTTAFAETLQGGSDWKVEFNGSKMSSNFTSADMKKISSSYSREIPWNFRSD